MLECGNSVQQREHLEQLRGLEYTSALGQLEGWQTYILILPKKKMLQTIIVL